MCVNLPCSEHTWGDITLKIGKKRRKMKAKDVKKVCLRIKFQENYPREPPFLQVFYRNFEELVTDDLKLLRNRVEQKAFSLCKGKGAEKPIIFELSLFLEEEYEKINEILTFYENMEREKEERKSKFIAIC